jgi:hypothetical protein
MSRPLTADVTEPAWNGYLLTVACSCGVVFERRVTTEGADADLLGLARLNWYLPVLGRLAEWDAAAPIVSELVLVLAQYPQHLTRPAALAQTISFA